MPPAHVQPDGASHAWLAGLLPDEVYAFKATTWCQPDGRPTALTPILHRRTQKTGQSWQPQNPAASVTEDDDVSDF
ncbi:unnamed protein product, partial [Protopolystoma xenopodis]